MEKAIIIERSAALVAMGERVVRSNRPAPEGVMGSDRVDSAEFYEWSAASLSFLHMVFSEAQHPHFRTFKEHVNGPFARDATQGLGILKAAYDELQKGFVGKLQNLVAAHIFTDFLEMAVHLREAGYKDAAASLGGAVLEDGLRRI